MMQPRDPFVLHAHAERANLAGRYDVAAQLFQEAAQHAFTRSGAAVLWEKAITAKVMADGIRKAQA